MITSIPTRARPAPPRIAAAAPPSECDASREFAFSAADFERVKRLIHQRCGIALGPAKQNLVYSRISRRVRAAGLADFTTYLDQLEASPSSGEWEAFTNALTTNLTSFFREQHHFPVLLEHLRSRPPASRPLTIWCSAASTGEEPYTLAITACEAFNTLTPPVKIIASDIDTQVLQAAERGVYALERVEALSAERLRRYFERGSGANAGFARVRAELRSMISFRKVNLLGGQWGVQGGLTAIFCRNVLIYFDRPTQAQVVGRFAPLLEADGLLFAGHSESLSYAKDSFTLRGKTVYARAAPCA